MDNGEAGASPECFIVHSDHDTIAEMSLLEGERGPTVRDSPHAKLMFYASMIKICIF